MEDPVLDLGLSTALQTPPALNLQRLFQVVSSRRRPPSSRERRTALEQRIENVVAEVLKVLEGGVSLPKQAAPGEHTLGSRE